MKITRLVELSLHFNVQKWLSRSRLKEKAKTANFKVYNLKYSTIQTDQPVVVYRNGLEVLDYTVNYVEGLIVFHEALLSTDVVEVDYTYCPINIYDESSNTQYKDFKYPAIAIYEEDREDKPFELGNAKKELHPTWVFEVWTERGGERNDITDTIMELFEEGSIPVIDYNIAFPINADGTRNTEFDELSQVMGYMTCDSINYRKGGSLDIGDKPKFLSEIMADLTINT